MHFLDAINHYKQMNLNRSHVVADLTALTRKGAKFIWTPNHQAAFDTLKLELAKGLTLTYPNSSKPLEIQFDASKLQLRAVISQDKKPLAFYSHKISDA